MFFTLMKTQDWVKTSVLFDNDICPTISASGVSLLIIIHVAVGFRFGTTLCCPHACDHCGSEVDSLGTHGLSCTHSEGRHARHAAINDIVHWALTAVPVPS